MTGTLTDQRWVYLDLGEVVVDGDLEVTICTLPADDEGVGELIAAAPRMAEALQKMRHLLRQLQPALNVMAREVMDDIIRDQIDPALFDALGQDGAET